MTKLTVKAPAFGEGGPIPKRFTCDGQDVSPELHVSAVPTGARCLAVIVEDPDAPGGTFVHWTAWNLPAEVTTIAEGVDVAQLGAAEGRTDFGSTGYGGPCPPAKHRYFFRVFALDAKLSLKAGARRKELDAAMEGHVLGRGETMGVYERG